MRLTALALLTLAPLAAAQLAAVRHEPGAPADPRLAALDPSGTRLRAVSRAADGNLRRLAGPLELQGADLDARAADFLARHAPLFGADAATTFGAPQPLQPRADGTPRFARLPQLVHGAEVQGAGLTLALDAAGRATGAHGRVSSAAAALPPPALTAAQAIEAALADRGLDRAALTGEPQAALVAVAGLQDAALRWRVLLVQRAGLQPWRVDVDAHSGAVAGARLERCTGTGIIELDGQFFAFNANGKGSGVTYKSDAKALTESEGVVTLTDMMLDEVEPGLALVPGTLSGRYCTVADFEAVLFSETFDFLFGDTDPTLVDETLPAAQAFDHVNTYDWITRSARFLAKVTGTLPSDICLPIIVNYDDGGVGLANAFYSPTSVDGAGPFGDGFFVFGDFDVATDDPMDDLSRDPTVVSHEYFHGMTDYAGLTFGDADLDTPSRAVNEAIADYGSATFHKQPEIGTVFVFHSGDDLGIPGTELRDLSLPLTMPGNLFDTVNPATDLPEEHEAGEIFGAALWRLRQNAKPKTADDLIINNLAAWPASAADVGFDPVTELNAEDAYEAYDFECFLALLNSALAPGGAKGWKRAGPVLGAFLAHGLAEDDGSIVALPTDGAKASLKIASAFLGDDADHAFALGLEAGQTLTITLTGAKADATQVDFDFPDAAPGDLDFPFAKVVNAAGTKVTQKKITVVNPGVYVLRFTTASGAGEYKAVIKLTGAG